MNKDRILSAPAVTYSMHKLIAANRRNTWLLFVLFIGLFTLLGAVIAAYWGAWWVGSVIAGLVAFFVVLFAFTSGDRVILRISGAHEITHADAPQLFNVVEEVALAAGIPFVAGISAPSSLAVEFARQSGQTLVGFLREGSFNVYAGNERICG